MTINIQYQGMSTSQSLSKIVTDKLDKLYKRYDWIIKANVLFKLEKNPTGIGRICEMELSAPGPRIFAKSDEDNFEKAAVETIHDLERQLRKRKQTFRPY
ncbi:MAG: ribosome-associated translation inhibitor RaiA [Bacteroidota bacterium]